MNEIEEIIKYKMIEYEAILKDIGHELCQLHIQNQSLRQRIHLLEQKHKIGSEHMIKHDFRKGDDYE